MSCHRINRADDDIHRIFSDYLSVVDCIALDNPARQLALAARHAGSIHDWWSALAHSTDAIRLDPGVASAFAMRGAALYQLRSRHAAIRDCSQAIALDATLAAAFYVRGSAFVSRGRDDQIKAAIEDLSTAIRLAPRMTHAYSHRGCLHDRLDQIELAVADFSAAIERSENPSGMYWLRATAYMHMGAYDKAIEDITAMIQCSRLLWSLPYALRSHCREVIGDHVGAIEDRRMAAQLGTIAPEKARTTRETTRLPAESPIRKRRDGLDGQYPSRRPTSIVYQFRLQLRGFDPPIWRRLQVKDCLWGDLNSVFQIAMGRSWDFGRFDACQPHDHPEFGRPWSVSLLRLISQDLPGDLTKFKFTWTLNSWPHDVLLEGRLTAAEGVFYPICVEGERAAPLPGFPNPDAFRMFLKVITDLRHPLRDEWLGICPFEPLAFDIGVVNAELAGRFNRNPPFDPADVPIRLRLSAEEVVMLREHVALKRDVIDQLDFCHDTGSFAIFLADVWPMVRKLSAAAEKAGKGPLRRRLERLIGQVQRLNCKRQERIAAWQARHAPKKSTPNEPPRPPDNKHAELAERARLRECIVVRRAE